MARDTTSGTSEPTVSNWTEQCVSAWLVPMSLQLPNQTSGSHACMPAVGVAPPITQHVQPGQYLVLGMGNWTPMASAYFPCDDGYGLHEGTVVNHAGPSLLTEPTLRVSAEHSTAHHASSLDWMHPGQVATPLMFESASVQHGGGHYALLSGSLSGRSTAASSCRQERADAKAAPWPPHGGKGSKSRISQASRTPRPPRMGGA